MMRSGYIQGRRGAQLPLLVKMAENDTYLEVFVKKQLLVSTLLLLSPFLSHADVREVPCQFESSDGGRWHKASALVNTVKTSDGEFVTNEIERIRLEGAYLTGRITCQFDLCIGIVNGTQVLDGAVELSDLKSLRVKLNKRQDLPGGALSCNL